ncbi:hypothetical protein [Niabella aquatica]
MKKAILTVVVCMGSLFISHAQTIKFGGLEFSLVNVKASLATLKGKKALRVERDLEKLPFDIKRMNATVDEPTFVKVKNLNFKNGVIEVKMLSRIQNPSPFEAARGFIGVAYRVNDDNSAFDAIYLRPTNGRADDQFRRNHTVQYYAYPDYKFDRLRKESNGAFETYADIGLDEWITIRIEIKDKMAKLYINNQKRASFIVSEMKGNTKSGSIGLWVDIGTEGYFKDFKVVNEISKD